MINCDYCGCQTICGEKGEEEVVFTELRVQSKGNFGVMWLTFKGHYENYAVKSDRCIKNPVP